MFNVEVRRPGEVWPMFVRRRGMANESVEPRNSDVIQVRPDVKQSSRERYFDRRFRLGAMNVCL
jgi:hypothetical protein